MTTRSTENGWVTETGTVTLATGAPRAATRTTWDDGPTVVAYRTADRARRVATPKVAATFTPTAPAAPRPTSPTTPEGPTMPATQTAPQTATADRTRPCRDAEVHPLHKWKATVDGHRFNVQCPGVPATAPEPQPEPQPAQDYASQSRAALRVLARDRGLKVAGTRQELAARLTAADDAVPSALAERTLHDPATA